MKPLATKKPVILKLSLVISGYRRMDPYQQLTDYLMT